MTPPTPEQIKAGVAGVFDRAAATYDQVGVDFFRPIGRFLVGRTDPRPGERVLDVGCGRGASAIPAAEAVGPTGSVVATDLAPAMVEEVRRAAHDLPWLRAEVGDAEQPPGEVFDIVQAGLVLFFLPSLDTALARYRGMLSEQGRLGFTWFGEPDARWEPVFDALTADLPQDERPQTRPSGQGPFASPSAMQDHLTAQGWRDVTTETLVHEVRVRDADHWFEWTWSQGYRFVLEKLEARDQLGPARERVRRLLDEMARDGGLAWRAEVHATIARP
ncbi:class I SAM-dependent methyltransferase [Nocardioides sp. R1-1]|uniref:class I SAM-dependent methyltransferase n=1 Tax=Nocardioides sp. R1-1 TaxID=3383502 RepID=UPI0038D16D63